VKRCISLQASKNTETKELLVGAAIGTRPVLHFGLPKPIFLVHR
jgi:hypothetical protein